MKKYLKTLREEDGFTLIEMLIVIMIVSILMLMVISNVGGVEESVSSKTNKGIVQTVESELLIQEMSTEGKKTAKELQEKGTITQKQLDIYNESKNPQGE